MIDHTETAVSLGVAQAQPWIHINPDYVVFFLVLIIVVVPYFLPTIIARNCKHKNLAAIFCLNLFTGWTGLGWVLSLVWALTK
jgi:hypothetical protein